MADRGVWIHNDLLTDQSNWTDGTLTLREAHLAEKAPECPDRIELIVFHQGEEHSRRTYVDQSIAEGLQRAVQGLRDTLRREHGPRCDDCGSVLAVEQGAGHAVCLLCRRDRESFGHHLP